MQSWKDNIRRDEVLHLWMQARENRETHQELATSIQKHIYTTTELNLTVDTTELLKMCEQVRKGMLKQLEAARSSNKTPTDFDRKMWSKAETRIPTILAGAKKASRTNYKDMFADLMAQVQAEETE